MTRFYAVARKDGGITILKTVIPVAEVFAKWHPDVLAQHTGDYREIQESDIPASRAARSKWYDTGSSIGIKA